MVCRTIPPLKAIGLGLSGAVCACGNAGPQDFRALPAPDTIFEVPQEVFGDTLRSFPHGREGRQELALDVSESDDGRYTVLLTITGLLDDSVAGEQHRAVLRPVEGGWRAVELGERWRCYAGRGPGSWTTKPCN